MIRQKKTSKRWTIIFLVVGFIIVGMCCGGPALVFTFVKRTTTAIQTAPATPSPLTPCELLDWYSQNRPDQPFVLHDRTRDNVDLRGTVLEINTRRGLRCASTDVKYRKKLTDMTPQARKYASKGVAQIVIHGEQENQEVICWFNNIELVAGISVGDAIVVRGRKSLIRFPLVEYRKEGRVEVDGGFTIDLVHCEVVE